MSYLLKQLQTRLGLLKLKHSEKEKQIASRRSKLLEVGGQEEFAEDDDLKEEKDVEPKKKRNTFKKAKAPRS